MNISKEDPAFLEVSSITSFLEKGGEYIPHCNNPEDAAIIVPYRDRQQHLYIFLHHIHPFIMKQEIIHYKIYIIHQTDSFEFNRASLMNIGFVEALKDFNWNCFIFHDVDHLPEDTRNLYSCTSDPILLAAAVDKWKYKMPYKTYFGGVVAMKKTQYEKINGASNMFWGWGGEDDDLRNRLVGNGLKPTVANNLFARYTTIHHTKEKMNPKRQKLLKEGKRRLK